VTVTDAPGEPLVGERFMEGAALTKEIRNEVNRIIDAKIP